MAVGHRRDPPVAGSLDGDPRWERCEPAPGVVAFQPSRGHRFGVEVYALADFALRGAPVRTGLDLGAGSGVLALLLASRGVCVTAVELRAEWLPALAAGVAASGLDLEVLRADARTIQAPAVDLVVSNPPWFPPASGPVSPDPLRAAARATLHGGPREFLAAALRLAPRACLVLRPADARALLSLAAVARAETLGDKVVLVEFTRGGDREAMDLADAGTVDVAAAYRRFGREAPTREGSSR